MDWGIVVLFAALSAVGAYDVQPLRVTPLSPMGIHLAYPHKHGVRAVKIAFSVNHPVKGYEPAEYEVYLDQRKGYWWVHTDMEVPFNKDDVVHYRIFVRFEGKSYFLTDQEWHAPEPNPIQQAGYNCTNYPCLIFEDEFNTLNFDNWQHELTAGGGGNWEFQYYTNNRTNSYVRDGTLYIKPTLTSEQFGEGFLSSGRLELWGASPANLCTGNQWYGCERQGTTTNYINPIRSARLRSVYSMNVRYGRVEVQAKMPQGDWIWPAIWMLPQYNEYGGWPTSGEIDLIESRGNRGYYDVNGNSLGVDRMASTLHWGPDGSNNRYYMTTAHKMADVGNFGTAFHTYRLDWTNTDMKFYVDDELILTVDPGANGFWEYGNFPSYLENPWQSGEKMAPFDRPFHIVMNVAVGGTNGYFPDGLTNLGGDKPWSNTSPTGPRDFWTGVNDWYPTWNPDTNRGEDAAMQVNYVRVYKLQAD